MTAEKLAFQRGNVLANFLEKASLRAGRAKEFRRRARELADEFLVGDRTLARELVRSRDRAARPPLDITMLNVADPADLPDVDVLTQAWDEWLVSLEADVEADAARDEIEMMARLEREESE